MNLIIHLFLNYLTRGIHEKVPNLLFLFCFLKIRWSGRRVCWGFFFFFSRGLKISKNILGNFHIILVRKVSCGPFSAVSTNYSATKKKKSLSLSLLLREDNVTSPLLLFYDYDYTHVRMYRKKRMQTCNTVSVGHTVFGQPYGSDIHFP